MGSHTKSPQKDFDRDLLGRGGGKRLMLLESAASHRHLL